jgi:ubiquinone biosynthesis protein UbiJ
VVEESSFESVRGVAYGLDTIIETNSATLAAQVYEGRDLAEVLHSGELKIEGDESAVERFLGLFPLPKSAAPAGT